MESLKWLSPLPHIYIFVFRSHRGSCVPRPKCPTSLSHDSDPKARVCHPNGRQWWRWSHISSGNLVGWVLFHWVYGGNHGHFRSKVMHEQCFWPTVVFFLPLSSNGITQENTRDWKTLIKTQAFQHAHDVCFGDCYYISWVRAVTQTKARFNFQLSTKNIIGLRFALHEFQQHLCSCRGILCSWLAGMWGKTCWTFCQEFGLFMQDLFIGSSDASVLLLGFRYRYLYKAVIPLWLIFS